MVMVHLLRNTAFLAILTSIFFFAPDADASHYRGGSIQWRVADPVNAPLTVTFTVRTNWRSSSVDGTTLQFGDGNINPGVTGATIGLTTDGNGNSITITEYSVDHTYSAAGSYTAFFESCCRVSGLQNGSSADFRIESTVVLAPGSNAGPRLTALPFVQLQSNATRTFTIPVTDPDGGTLNCRFATSAESGLPAGQGVPSVPADGSSPIISTTSEGCQVVWNLTNAVAGQQFVIALAVDSVLNGQTRKVMVDYIVEIVTPPLPVCTVTGSTGGLGAVGASGTSGSWVLFSGQTFTANLTATDSVTSSLAASTFGLPAGATAPSTTQATPYTQPFVWTPAVGDSGKLFNVIVRYTNAINLTGACTLLLEVANCSLRGQACSGGVGSCSSPGVYRCQGSLNVCDAVPGVPAPEVCDNGADEDCDGNLDNGCCGNGVVNNNETCDDAAANGTASSCCEANCSVRAAGEVCDVASGLCDLDDTCDAAGTCVVNVAAINTECNASAGICDVAEVCDGINTACPADVFVPANTACRAAGGICDVAEVCDGASAACPANAFVPANTACRAAAGLCDVAELCDGANAACPANVLAQAGTECNPSLGVCDVAELCDGANVACPADLLAQAGTECRSAGGICDVAELCDGAAVACPADLLAQAGTECRAAGGICDVAELCDGADVVCPADAFAAADVICRPSTGACDIAELCDGSTAACADNAFEADGTSCADAETCNGEETCAAGNCEGTTPLDCMDDNACTADSCLDAEGCTNEPILGCCLTDEECDDNDACTENTCVDNLCVSATAAACENNDVGSDSGSDAGDMGADATADMTADTDTTQVIISGGGCATTSTDSTIPWFVLMFGMFLGRKRLRRKGANI